jgi:hypothetical protein
MQGDEFFDNAHFLPYLDGWNPCPNEASMPMIIVRKIKSDARTLAIVVLEFSSATIP